MDLALLIKEVCIQYTYKSAVKTAVENFSLDIRDGEFFGLLGPNGAGKTSLISAITGLIPYQSGEIKIFGHSPRSRESKFLIGVVPQEIVGYGFFTVNEVLQFHSGYFGITNNQKKIDELLERLQLSSYKNKLVSQLSGGMKRRMLIARSLVHLPRILLLDEPSAGVDIELRAILWEFAEELNRNGTTIVLTTHYLEEAERLCKRVAVMNHGKLLALDETGSLIRSMSERIVSLQVRDFQITTSLKPPRGFSSLRQEGDRVIAQISSDLTLHDVMSALDLPLEKVIDLRTEEGDLEHAFLKLVQRGPYEKHS